MTQETTTNPNPKTENHEPKIKNEEPKAKDQAPKYQTQERNETASEILKSKTKTESQNEPRTKIKSSTHPCITIRWWAQYAGRRPC